MIVFCTSSSAIQDQFTPLIFFFTSDVVMGDLLVKLLSLFHQFSHFLGVYMQKSQAISAQYKLILTQTYIW